MPIEVPFFISYISLYIVSLQILNCNSKSSTHWKLKLEDGKVLGLDPQLIIRDELISRYDVSSPRLNKDLGQMYQNERHKNLEEERDAIGDTVFNIIVSTILNKGLWFKNGSTKGESCDDNSTNAVKELKEKAGKDGTKQPVCVQGQSGRCNNVRKSSEISRISCTPNVNFTEYDTLSGVANRHNHRSLPEPDIIKYFQKKGSLKREVGIKAIQKHLEKLLQEKPNSRNTLHQIGNYWRIKGDTRNSIECFRKILKQQPNDRDALLSLGRILFQLGYLEDAAFLIRKSLEQAQNHPDDFFRHFTLGQILKSYGHHYEASLYIKQSLVLNPDYKPALELLNDLQSLPETSVHAYTLFIIAFLVLAVLLGVLSTIEVVSGVSEDNLGVNSTSVEVTKTQRHFNRAMAMRSMKLAVNSRPFRFKKY